MKVDLEGPHPIASGDTFLLCSDGLTGPVKDDEIGMVLGAMPPAEAARALVDLANMRGGPDNITVVIVKAVGPVWSQSADAPQPRAALRPVLPMVWIALGVLMLAGLLLLLVQQLIPAAACLVATAALAAGAWIYRQGGEDEKPTTASSRHGRGPYTSIVCPPSREFAVRLAETICAIRETAAGDDLTLDAAAFNALYDQAAAAEQSGDFAQAVRVLLSGDQLSGGRIQTARQVAGQGDVVAQNKSSRPVR